MSSGFIHYETPGWGNLVFDFTKQWAGTNDPTRKVEQTYWMWLFCVARTPIVTHDGNGNYIGTNTEVVPFENVYIPFGANDDIKLVGKLISQIRGHDLNAAVSAAELPESVGAVYNTAKSFYKAYKQTKSGDFSGAVRTLTRATAGTGVSRRRAPVDTKDVADAWLSMKWGWLPLLQDIYNVWDFIDSRNNTPRQFRAKARVTVRGEVDVSTFHRPELWSDSTSMKEYRTRYTELTVPRALGLYNPELVVWEKIPFSCVLDWFVPIGDWLEARAFVGALSHTTARTTKQRFEFQWKQTACEDGPSTHTPHNQNCRPPYPYQYEYERRVHTGMTQKGMRIEFRRDTGVSIGVPSSPELKALDKIFSLDHLATAAALWRSFSKA